MQSQASAVADGRPSHSLPTGSRTHAARLHSGHDNGSYGFGAFAELVRGPGGGSVEAAALRADRCMETWG